MFCRAVRRAVSAMKYCSACGAVVSLIVPAGDNRPRFVCSQCNEIHYQNPKIVAGCVVSAGGRVLLCRRAIEPRYGLWTVPAGFMENGETTEQAAARETFEEAQAQVDVEALYAVFNLPHIDQVYMMFRGRLRGDTYAAGAESLDVALFEETEIPWDTLAFPVVKETLRLYFEDRVRGEFPVRTGTIERLAGPGFRYRAQFL